MVSLGDMDRSSSISMTITVSGLSLSRPLAKVSIPTIMSMKTLRTPVCVAAASIRMVGNTSIARLSSCKGGKGCNNCYNFSCHGYKCTKLSQIVAVVATLATHEDPEDSCVCSCCLHKDGRQHLHSQALQLQG